MRKAILLLAGLSWPAIANAQLSVADQRTVEGKQWCAVVQLPAPATKTTSFSYRTVNDTAQAPADFAARSGKQSVRRGTSRITICGATTDNAVWQGDRQFFFEIFNAAVPISRARAAMVIGENDPAPPPPAALSLRDGSVVIEGQTGRADVERSGGDLSKGATYSYLVNAGTATAGVDFDRRSGTLKFGPGQTLSSFTFPTRDDAEIEPDETVVALITSPDAPVALSQVEIVIKDNDVAAPPPPPPVICPDGTQLPAGSTCPEPPPPPPDETGQNGNVWVPSPTPSGKVPVNLGNGDLTPAPIPGTAAPDVVGAMRFICRAGEIKKIDSLLYWGQPGKAHWHVFYGLSKNEADDTYQTMQTKDAYSTCMMPSADPANRSAYWTTIPILKLPAGATPPPWAVQMDPTLAADLGPDGKLLRPREFFWVLDHFQLYYKRFPETDPACTGTSPWGPKYTGCVQLPHGINMIFGFNMAELQDGPVPATFQCTGAGTAFPQYKGDATPALADCANAWDAGQRADLRLSIKQVAPGCWDPRYLDSPNHMDHLSYSVQKLGTGRGGCMVPGSGATDLKLIPGLSLLSSYGWNEWVQAAVRADPKWGVRCSSDDHLIAVKPEMAKACRTFHADVRASWLDSVLKRFANCFNKLLNASAGNLCDGTMMRGGSAPWYPSTKTTRWAHPTPVVPIRPEGYSAEW